LNNVPLYKVHWVPCGSFYDFLALDQFPFNRIIKKKTYKHINRKRERERKKKRKKNI
jgi:hypothetical protein